VLINVFLHIVGLIVEHNKYMSYKSIYYIVLTKIYLQGNTLILIVVLFDLTNLCNRVLKMI